MLKFAITGLVVALTSLATPASEWKVESSPNPSLGGSRTDVTADGKLIAQFIWGEGQLKPYLNLFGENGEQLTEWSPDQQFSHHRGIYIGWNRVRSGLGRSDVWHLRGGERMIVKSVGSIKEPDGSKVPQLLRKEDQSSATLVAEIEWHAAKADENGSSLLLNETRKMVISRPGGKRTQVDVTFILEPVRDLSLDGDLQHSGIHFRASHKVGKRENETRYVWEPDLPGPGGKVVSPDLKWARLIFPLEEKWYSATHLNAPSNPVEELSWRGYGRFGFFFKKDLKKGEKLTLNYRFVTQPASEAPAKEVLKEHRQAAEREYERYLKDLTKGS